MSYTRNPNNVKAASKGNPDALTGPYITPDEADEQLQRAQILASRKKLEDLNISDRNNNSRVDRNYSDDHEDGHIDRGDRYSQRGGSYAGYADRPPPPPPPSAIQTARRETDDRRNPHSPIARDSGDDHYRSRGPMSRSSYGPGTSSYHDDGGSRHLFHNSKDDQDYDQGERLKSSTRPAPAHGPATKKKADAPRVSEEVRRYFNQVDRDGSGQLSEAELGRALVNGDYTTFDPYTVRMMIRMFDADRSGTINVEEFSGLWSYLHEWRVLFNRFDVDKSGTIDIKEFRDALIHFGYRLSDDYVDDLFRTYDTRRREVLSFDLFVQCCISLARVTDVFKRYDHNRDGYITISFEDFLTEVLSQR